MTQDQLVILCFKVALISGFCSLAVWISLYTALAKWWRNPIGRSLVRLAALTAGLYVPTTLSLFFNLNRFDSRMVGWVDVVMIALVTPEMLWRSVVWWRLHKAGGLPRDDGAGKPQPKRLATEAERGGGAP
jgi:hypothetical protein